MMRRTILLAALTAALTAMGAAGAVAGGPHDRAVGDITAEVAGYVLETSFNAHDDAPGANADRGIVTTTATKNGLVDTATVRLDCVEISGDEARFSGTIVEGTGRYAAGGTMGFWASDSEAGDRFNQWWNGGHCTDGWGSPGGPVVDGDLKVFSAE